MSLRSILSSEGLLPKTAALTVSNRTRARLMGGSLAVKLGVADLLVQASGRMVTQYQQPRSYRTFIFKPGWAKLVDRTAAMAIVDALQAHGFEAISGSITSDEGMWLSKMASATPGLDNYGEEKRGVRCYVTVIKYKDEYAVINGDTNSCAELEHGIKGFNKGDPAYSELFIEVA